MIYSFSLFFRVIPILLRISYPASKRRFTVSLFSLSWFILLKIAAATGAIPIGPEGNNAPKCTSELNHVLIILYQLINHSPKL